MSEFNILNNSEDNPFERQERIEWWNQESLKSARVLVIGAGATGNETLKNLVLLGIGNILICDMDSISVSNLSRTVLFRKEDAGRKKAETAALRVKEIALEESCCIDFFEGDVVWELGTGVYRYFDVVLGCLDNVETRFALNRNCRLVSKPWVDSGISELSGNIKVFAAETGACYQCFASDEQLYAARQRYSCDDFKKRIFSEHKMPTVQISSAIASALQVQEAIKIILGKKALYSKKIYFQGTTGDFELINLNEDENCYAHVTYDDIIETPFVNSITLREFLQYVSQSQFSGKGAALDFRGDRTFLLSLTCSTCGEKTYFYKPSFKLFTDEVKCTLCSDSPDASQYKAEYMEYIYDFSLETEEKILDMSLNELGVPKLHILSIRSKDGSYKYYELSEDLRNVLPLIYTKE